MRIELLGPLAVRDQDGRTAEIGGARLRTLLIRLALEPGRAVPTDALVDAVWPACPPAGAANALQALVSRLRRVLPEPHRLVAAPGGYRLEVTDRDVDEFERLSAAGRSAAEPDRAVELLRAALALWRGPALVDVADEDFARAAGLRLEELRLAATEDRIQAELRAGNAAAAVAELTALIDRYPLRERAHGLLMRAHAQLGRTGEALRVYQRLRRTLADELGCDPSPELADLHRTLLRGDESARGNLRHGLTSFVGRDAELTRVHTALRDARLVTLVGPGGAGKTRLAAEAGHLLKSTHDGVWLVELAPVRDPAEVPAAVLEALRPARIRLEASGGRDPREELIRALADRHLLLILDNCEHVVTAGAHLAERLLGACPGVRILATSREPLAVTGEVLCPVGPLAEGPAVRLFADRAAHVRPGFAVTATTAAQVTEICQRLDGLPLAIELAAARLRTLPVDVVAARLGDRFRLLSGGSRTALPRHQTLQAVVDWSWDLLDKDEQRLARRLSVFLDGTTLDSVEIVCAGNLDTISALVDKSLVTVDDAGRYGMLETIRAYAAERLAESGEAAEIRDAHAAYFRTLTLAAEPHLRGRDQLGWLDRLTAERDNLAAALRWAIDRGDAATAVGLTGTLGWFWALRNHHAEAVDWLAQALALPGEVAPAVRRGALAHYALNLLALDRHDAARSAYAVATAMPGDPHPLIPMFVLMDGMFHDDEQRVRQALPDVLIHPDPWVRAIGIGIRGRWRQEHGDLSGADQDSTESLRLLRELGDRWAVGVMLGIGAELAALRGDHDHAIALLTEAVALGQELRVEEDLLLTRYSLATQWAETGRFAEAQAELERAAAVPGPPERCRLVLTLGAGDLARLRGEPTAAITAYRQALEVHPRVVGLPAEVGPLIRLNLARAVLAGGDVDEARRLAAGIGPTDARLVLANLAEVLAAIAVADRAPHDAARLLGCAAAVRGLANQGSREVTAVTAATRALLGDEEYATEYATTAAYSLGEARSLLQAQARRR